MKPFVVAPVLRLAPASALVIALFACGPALAGTATSLPRLSAQECEVWMRELSFAQSVADHDTAAFEQHVDERAAFASSRTEPQRGRAHIVRQWATLIAGTPVKLAWYPTRVTMGGRPDMAWSSGPALYEDTTPGAKERYHLGAFNSVWSRGEDGVWRVMFDDGIRPVPATLAQVDAFRAGRRDCTSLTSP
ncbi:YybH family protein [Agrilutibacter solisilvae]|uniref:YybH family protein n=1 Tax=Agrilutibacter solisilvae TaxID=2763317 RepID=UPI001FD68049|nr:DUF4440 domain-containing protein [Lysobacter solisilvae]